MPIQRACQVCGKFFYATPSSIKAGLSKFCSRKCFGISTRTRIEVICQTCKIPFCTPPNRTRVGRGKFCSKACYYKNKKVPAKDRFWEKTNKNSGHFAWVDGKESECWVWTRGIRGNGRGYNYGAYTIDNDRLVSAHRYAYMLTYGGIPEGISVLHKCDNPPYVRPDHLFLGTAADNTADMFKKGRQGKKNKKLTKLQAKHILSLKGKELARKIATRFGISSTTVYQIWKRKTWSHIALAKAGLG